MDLPLPIIGPFINMYLFINGYGNVSSLHCGDTRFHDVRCVSACAYLGLALTLRFLFLLAVDCRQTRTLHGSLRYVPCIAITLQLCALQNTLASAYHLLTNSCCSANCMHVITLRTNTQQLSLQKKCGDSRIIRSPRFFSTSISIFDVEGIKIAMTSRHNGRKVLSTQPLATMQRLFGRTSLLNVGGAAHTRLKKLMHPTISVSCCTRYLTA
jgi:hypothetical protein